MRWSKSFLFTLRDAPADAEIDSHKLMMRAGLIRKVAPGIYTFGTLGLRAVRKFENIVREELNKRGAQEILMPVVQPAELWQETGRYEQMGAGLLKFKNRNDQNFVLGATHEEVVTDYVRKDVKSYRDLPFNLYQIQTKYRDEIRPRFGLMRCREFIMKDAYSFDENSEGALKTYQVMYDAYCAIFDRLGLKYRIVQADAGNIGGSQTHEFQVLADAGEDHLMVCNKCDFAANIEVAPALDRESKQSHDSEKTLETFATPGLKQISSLSKALSIPENELVKTLFFASNESDPELGPIPIAILLRGSDELNPVKLKNLLGLSNPPLMLTDKEVQAATGAYPGSCGPVGLKMPVYADTGVAGFKNFIVGANKDGFHMKNVNFVRDFKLTQTADLRLTKAGDCCPKCDGSLQSVRGIEVGHVFYLGTKYSTAMNATFLDREGKATPMEMGCFGIGITRTVQAAIEQSHDKDGIIWPMSIAPIQVHICLLDPLDEEVKQAAEIIYSELKSHGIDCLLDDRDERPGVKFKDADLIGAPLRINVGARALKANELELIIRQTKETRKIAITACVDEALSFIRAARQSAGVPRMSL